MCLCPSEGNFWNLSTTFSVHPEFLIFAGMAGSARAFPQNFEQYMRKSGGKSVKILNFYLIAASLNKM